MLRRTARLVLALSWSLTAAGLAAAQEELVPTCGDSLCLQIAWGEAAHEFPTGDTLQSQVPAPLFDVEERTLYLLDRIQGRLLTHSRSGSRLDTLPSFDGIPFADFTDLRSAYSRLFFLDTFSPTPRVYVYDPATRHFEEIALRLEGEMKPPEKPFTEAYKLTVGPDGVYLFLRPTQWSEKIYDGRIVPPGEQKPEEGLVVGKERVRFEMPQGVIRTVSGRPLASGQMRASGDGCLLVYAKRGGREVLEMYDLERRLSTRTPVRQRERWRMQGSGTRLRAERGYYEIYFDRSGLSIAKWNCPGW